MNKDKFKGNKGDYRTIYRYPKNAFTIMQMLRKNLFFDTLT